MNVFFASSASLLTDHRMWGEGLLAWSIVDGLARRGHRVVACADEIDVRSPTDAILVKLRRTGRFESLTPILRPRDIDRVLRETEPAGGYDAVHWLFPQMDEEVRLPRTPGARSVIGPLPRPWPVSDRATGLRAGDLLRAPMRPWLRARYRRELQRADVLLSSLPEVHDRLPPELAAKSRVVGFGIDPQRFSVDPLPSVPTVLFAGRLIENKRIRLLVRAFGRVLERVPDATLLVAGEGEQRALLGGDVERLGISSQVEFLDAIPHGDMPALIGRCSLVCLPSVGEPFGMAVLEAMAAGRAVVAVGIGGPRHLVAEGRGGKLVAPDDEASLAEAIAGLLCEPAVLEAMGRFNRGRAELEFSWDHVLGQLEEAYA